MLIHPLEPIISPTSRILILGSFPSIASREELFYYAHPRNRFWEVLSQLTCKPLPKNNEDKITFLQTHRIALWDVIHSCRIQHSSDSTIRDVIPNDIISLLAKAPITHIFANGSKSFALCKRYIAPQTSLPISLLPSTSPANAAYSLEKLIQQWGTIMETLS